MPLLDLTLIKISNDQGIFDPASLSVSLEVSPPPAALALLAAGFAWKAMCTGKP